MIYIFVSTIPDVPVPRKPNIPLTYMQAHDCTISEFKLQLSSYPPPSVSPLSTQFCGSANKRWVLCRVYGVDVIPEALHPFTNHLLFDMQPKAWVVREGTKKTWAAYMQPNRVIAFYWLCYEFKIASQSFWSRTSEVPKQPKTTVSIFTFMLTLSSYVKALRLLYPFSRHYLWSSYRVRVVDDIGNRISSWFMTNNPCISSLVL